MNRRIACVALGVRASLSAAGAARADTLYLSCTMSGGARQEALTIDLERNTVNNRPATINPTAIDWSVTIGGDSTGYVRSGKVTDHVDRTAGTLTEYATYYLSNGNTQSSNPDTGPCTKAAAPATKF
jgi:hypothetical protein